MPVSTEISSRPSGANKSDFETVLADWYKQIKLELEDLQLHLSVNVDECDDDDGNDDEKNVSESNSEVPEPLSQQQCNDVDEHMTLAQNKLDTIERSLKTFSMLSKLALFQHKSELVINRFKQETEAVISECLRPDTDNPGAAESRLNEAFKQLDAFSTSASLFGASQQSS